MAADERPRQLTLDAVRELGWAKMNPFHAHAVTVPGAVRGWHDLLERHGTMSLGDVLTDAIHYASDGFPTAPVVGHRWERSGTFLHTAVNAEEYLPNGNTPQAGHVLRLPGLANTLRAIAEGGPEAFYTGPVADAIVSFLQAQGGVMTLDDLKNHHSTWDDPIHTDYRGVTVYECPPNGQGLTALIAMNIAENFDLKSLPWDSPQRLHLMVESMRLAWADAHEYIADMRRADVPVSEQLLSKDYAASSRRLDLSLTAQWIRHRLRASFRVAPTRSISASSMVPATPAPSSRASIGASVSASSPRELASGCRTAALAFRSNRATATLLAPGKRPYHTIIPGMALKDGELWASFGVMGGFMQPQGHFQVISAMVDDDLNPQEALNRPRWYIKNGDPGGELLIEDGTPFKTMADLAERGHRIQPEAGLGRGNFGRGQIIRYVDGVLHGGSEPRADGQIAAF